MKYNNNYITITEIPGHEDSQSAEIEYANILRVKKAIG